MISPRDDDENNKFKSKANSIIPTPKSPSSENDEN